MNPFVIWINRYEKQPRNCWPKEVRSLIQNGRCRCQTSRAVSAQLIVHAIETLGQNTQVFNPGRKKAILYDLASVSFQLMIPTDETAVFATDPRPKPTTAQDALYNRAQAASLSQLLGVYERAAADF